MSPVKNFSGALLLLLIALALPTINAADAECDPNEGKCPTQKADCSNPITGFSIFYSRPEDSAAFVQDFRPLISTSRNEPGNCGYEMFTNPVKPGQLGFVEKYADLAALDTHLKSEHVTSVFTHQYYKELKAQEPMLGGPWVPVAPKAGDDEEVEMVFYWTMDCPKAHIWDIITNWTDASWVKGNPTATIVPLGDDGMPMSEEDAANAGEVDLDGGLGPVVQRRTWPNGYYLDVRMLTKDRSNFTTVQQTLSSLVFPKVAFDKFYVTLTLDSEGLDDDTQARMRYHTRATLKTGTFDDARETLKSDFYGPRIEFYQQYFNCSKGIQVKRAETGLKSLHEAMQTPDDKDAIATKFADPAVGQEFFDDTFEEVELDSSSKVSVYMPVKPVAMPDLRVMAVEDISVTSLSGATMISRIVIYQFDAWGRVVSTRVFDDMGKGGKARRLMRATNNYFKALETKSIKQVRKKYADDAVLEDPVGFFAPRTFDSVYEAFYKLATKFEYKRSKARTFVDVESMQTAQVVDASFELASGGELKASPVQVLTFNRWMKITHFEAFFTPTVVDFSKL